MDEDLGRVPRYRQHARQVSDQQLKTPGYDATSYLLAGDIADHDQHDASAGDPAGRRDSDSYLSKTTSRPTSVSEIAMKRLSVAPAWQHKLNEKHLSKVPSQSETVRYFDRSRQTRRVLLDCLWMWSGTAVTCAALAALLRYFETIDNGATRLQKYVFNTISNGLLLILGIAFAAQFKQYCEMMRWRFLASSYWTLDEFDEVLACDSWRSAIRLIARRRKKGWLPTKLQVIAAAWVFTFVVFNIVSAALGLTYSLENAESGAHLKRGDVSVANYTDDPIYIYTYAGQLSGALLDGEEMTRPAILSQDFNRSMVYFQPSSEELWWYRFLDQNPDTGFVYGSQRTINCSASCNPLQLEYAGRAGDNASFPRCNEDSIYTHDIYWMDETDQRKCLASSVFPVTYTTYWFGNLTSISDASCGSRCAQLLVYQSMEAGKSDGFWECNNTLGNVEGASEKEYQDPDFFNIPDPLARAIAGAIGLSRIEGQISSDIGSDTQMNQVVFLDPEEKSEQHESTATVTSGLMQFTIGAIASYDQFVGSRTVVTGLSPSAPLVMHVKWRQAGPILVGIPLVQLLMLFGVVWYSGKAIILEPSYLTAAHLLSPVMEKLGRRGVLMTVDEMAEAMGPDFKVAYTVRPSAEEPGHHNKDFVRDLALVEESEGFGYIRGKMPEGRYG